jgi:hypothetical protein
MKKTPLREFLENCAYLALYTLAVVMAAYELMR